MRHVVPLTNRVVLSLRGEPYTALRDRARRLIRNRLVIKYGPCSADATAHRQLVYDRLLTDKGPIGQARKRTMELLFNDDIRDKTKIIHNERGCCRSERQTMYYFLTIGVKALFPSRPKRIDTTDWGDTTSTFSDLALPCFVHGIFESAYLEVPSIQDATPLAFKMAGPTSPAQGCADVAAPPLMPDNEACPEGDLPVDVDADEKADPAGSKEPLHKEKLEERLGYCKHWVQQGRMGSDIWAALIFFRTSMSTSLRL